MDKQFADPVIVLPSTAVREIRPVPTASPVAPVVVGLVVIGLFFGIFGVWAAMSPLNGAVVGEGVVSVEGHRKSIEHFEGGIVKELRVKEGDMVGEGDVLVTLDDTRARSLVEILSQQLAVARALEARLLAERGGADTIAFPADLADSALTYVKDALASEREAFETRRAFLDGAQDILRRRIDDLGEQIKGRQLRVQAVDQQIASLEAEKAALDELFGQGLSTNQRIYELERALTAARSEREDNLSAVASAQVNIAENEQQIDQLTYERRTEVAARLAEVQQKLLDLGPNLSSARVSLDRSVVLAPAAGRVVGLKVNSPSEVIPPGGTIMEIVPQQTSLVISTRFRVEDIADLRPGADAEVHFTSLARIYVPVLHGKVTLISADRLTDERTGLAYYTGEVVINADELSTTGTVEMYPGMPATVMVMTNTRSALEYLLGPFTATFDGAFRQG